MSKYPSLVKFARYSCVLLFVLFVGGCGGGYSAPPQVLTISVTPATAAMATGQSMLFAATGDPSGVTWSVSSTSATPGTIDASGNYTAPSGAQSLTAVIKATSKTNPVYSSSVSVNVVAPGLIAPTNNVQVAQYTVSPAAAANVSVQFGLDTSYGLTTWTQPAPAAGGAVSLFVAGMKQSTLYHMRGVVAFADGSSFNDADQTFTTGALTKGTATHHHGHDYRRHDSSKRRRDARSRRPSVTQLLLPLLQTLVTDLNGNVIWGYNPRCLSTAGAFANPIKLLPNGHFLINLERRSQWHRHRLRAAGGGPGQQCHLANDGGSAQHGSGCRHLRRMQYHGDWARIMISPSSKRPFHRDCQPPRKHCQMERPPTGDVVIDLGDMDNLGGNNPNHTPLPVWALE